MQDQGQPSCSSTLVKVKEPSAPPAPSEMNMLMDSMSHLTRLVQTMASTLDDNRRQMTDIVTTNTKLLEENNSLRRSITDVSTKLNQLTWKSFRQQEPKDKNDLLIGSSLIRDVDKNKLNNTEVVCKPGGTIATISKELDRAKDYDQITLVIGGNDCDRQPPTPADTIVKSYNDLIQKACMRANNVTVSSICPRLKTESTNSTINDVNAGLVASCSDNDKVHFVDNTPSFMLADGSINDGYLHQDGVHLTRSAVNKLARNLKLKTKNEAGVFRERSAKPQQTTNDKPDTRYGWQEVQVQPRRKSTNTRNATHDHRANTLRNETVRCEYCYETGHNRSTCRHGKPVQCHHCGYSGHKAKFCEHSTQ